MAPQDDLTAERAAVIETMNRCIEIVDRYVGRDIKHMVIEAIRSEISAGSATCSLFEIMRRLPCAGGTVWIDEEELGWTVSYGDDDSQDNFAFGLNKKDADALHDLLMYRQQLDRLASEGG